MTDPDRPRATTASPSTDRQLSISVFARRSMLSMKALRLYDRLGLLRPDSVNPDNGYRVYRESQLEPARLIGLLRRLDMPLATVAAVIGAAPADRPGLLAAYWWEIQQRHGQRRELVAYLQQRFSGNERQFDMYEIHERDIPEQIILTEQRHTTVAGLTDWMGAAIGRHWQTAEAYGGISGPIFVIFHGAVDEDSDGPVEVCGPISPPEGTTIEHANRIEPAHHEVYLRLRKSQVEYPQILTAYDAIDHWIAEQGRTPTGESREVNFTDFMNAGPDDEVTDIARPIQ